MILDILKTKKNSLVFLKYKKNKYFFKVFLNFFFLPVFLISNKFNLSRFVPNSGDLIIVKFFYRYTGIRFTLFKFNICFGICISRSFCGLNSFFIIRNSYKRNAFELKFLLYSPLLKSIRIFFNRRRFYTKSKLNFLRLKKIFFSRIFL